MSNRKLVIAIDFGTTFSKVCWSLGSESAKLIRKWPGMVETRESVPTIVYYDRAANVVGWGYDAGNSQEKSRDGQFEVLRPGYCKAEWFKLRLSDSMRGLALPPIPANLGPLDVILDFLRFLREATEKEILLSMPKSIWDNNRANIQFVLTVPAIWDLPGRQAMRECFTRAGWIVNTPDQLIIVAEPESAATYYALAKHEDFDWRNGDNILIIDAGGGTVDLITYAVTSTNPFQVGEAVRGTAGFCGGTFVNKELEKTLYGRLNALPAQYRQYAPNMVQDMLSAWETAFKEGFGDSDGIDLTIDTKLGRDIYIPACGISHGCMYLAEDELTGVFQRICDQIISLVKRQLADLAATGVKLNSGRIFPILVGGFGKSVFLREAIRQSLQPEIAQNLGQYADGPTAVVYGAQAIGRAKCSGENGTVSQHVARKHYLIPCISPLDPNNPTKNGNTFLHPLTGQPMTHGAHIFVHKGEKISIGHSYSSEFLRRIPYNASRVFTTSLYESDADHPPTGLDSTCVEVCQMVTDLSLIPWSAFRKIKKRSSGCCGLSTGEVYYEIHFILQIGVGDGNIDLELLFNGRSYGKQPAIFNKEY